MSLTPDEATSTAAPVEHRIASGHEGSIRDQVRAYLANVRHGEMGVLPAVAGFVVLSTLFAIANPLFLTTLNLANLLTQTATLLMLAVALTFVILLAEIDLSAGVTSGVGMGIYVVLVNQYGVDWIVALLCAFLFGAVVGSLIGYFVAIVGVPSFVVTLGLFLGFQGLQLVILAGGSIYRVETPEILALMNSTMPAWAGWALVAVIVLTSSVTALLDRRRRANAGVPTRPLALTVIRIAFIGGAAVALVAILNQDRSVSILPISGVPLVVPLALLILWVGTFVLDRTRFGRHLYAIGGNPDAARRAGIRVAGIRVAAFMICSMLAIVSGLLAASRAGSVATDSGRAIVLSGVAAAVVGGVSLFGGRGRLVHAAIGALVIAVIDNGLGLLGLPAGVSLLVTGGVLVLAATIDAVSRKRGSAGLRT